jgi:hypothetical protein
MTAFTLFHTLVSVLAVGFGSAALVRDRGIDPRNRLGKLYLGTMLVGSVSSFGFIPALGFTPGQVLTLVTLALLAVGTLTLSGRRREPGFTQTIALSASYLLLMVFFTTETLKAVPAGHPFASSAADPALLPVRLGLVLAFLIGVTYQVFKIRADRPVARLRRIIAEYHHAA